MTSERQTRRIIHLFDGALSKLPDVLDELGAASPFLVVDTAAVAAAGAEAAVDSLTRSRRAVRFEGFEPNPKLEDVERGVDAFRASGCDAAVAIGGGTAIDLAKLIGVTSVHADAPRDLATGAVPIRHDAGPIVAIPTTAGTGSEATHFAVVYVDGEKRSVAHESLLPTAAIVDPLLTHAMPPRLTMATGLDAFCQAVESIWAVGATEESLVDATAAVRLAYDNLERAVHAPDASSREAMCRAAHLAGRAINVSKTTLCHAISYPITSGWGIPHGEAVALTLAAVLRFNAGVSADDCVDPRGPESVRERIGLVVQALAANSVEDACECIVRLIVATGARPSLAEMEIAPDDVDPILDHVDPLRLANNPRRSPRTALSHILAGVLGRSKKRVLVHSR